MQTLHVRDGGTEGGQGVEVYSCVYSADGAFVLSAGWDGFLRLWLSANGQQVSSLQVSSKPLSCCAFSRDGTGWVSASMDGTLSWWDAVTHHMKQSFIAHIRPISAIQISPDGRFMATAAWDRKLLLRRVGDEREGRVLAGHTDIVAGCRWSLDSKQLLSWSHDGTLRLWDADSAREAARFDSHSDRVTAACLSRDGAWAISGSRDGLLKLWDLRRRAETRSVQMKQEVRGCWCLADGTSLLTVNADGWMVLWSLPDFEVQAELASTIRAICGALSPCGNEVVLGSEKGNLHFVTVEGKVDTALVVRPTLLFKPNNGVITRFLGKQKVVRAYQYICPACGQTAETACLPSEAIPCASCKRLLHLRDEVPQLQTQ
ncbi:MAG TPA: WD40 repeat domain-containing protein [Gemmataceae bacterium]|nr:WD40 repeat domain-containing protein [Gemmataceae bacterium]